MCRVNIDLYKIGHTDRHFVDDGTVELFDISQDTDIFESDEVDRHTLSAESTTSTNSVQVGFSKYRKESVSISTHRCHRKEKEDLPVGG